MKNPTVTRFPNIRTVSGGQDTPLAAIIADIASGACRAAVEQARAAFRQGGKQAPAYAAAKAKLPYFTPGGTFSHRSSTGLTQSSGLLQGDIDELNDSQLAYARHSLIADPYTVYVFTSPSGAGLKFAFAIAQVADNAGYRGYFDALCTYISKQYEFALDEACKSISHPCYLSWDPDAYHNPGAKIFAPTITKPKRDAPLPKPTSAPRPHFAVAPAENLMERRLNHVMAKIESAPDGEKHNTRFRQARLLGGWEAAGLLPPGAIEMAAEIAASNSANPTQARKDIHDGVRSGQGQPLYEQNRPLAAMYQREARGARLYHG